MAEELTGRAAWALMRAIAAIGGDSGGGASGSATYVRRDSDGTAWVRLPGADRDVPVNGQVLAEAAPGQLVGYTLRDGRLSISGNASSPAVGVERVREEVAPAAEAAASASVEAQRAKMAADAAELDAERAHDRAVSANSSAHDALAQLSTVEDVLGTVTWLAEHGSYDLTTDTALDPTKTYYVRSGTAPDYVYTPVGEPVAADLPAYYELTVDDALSDYVASHLALTDAGLWVLKDDSGYRVLLANDGMSVVDPNGHVVATYGESITFDASRPQHIGGEDAYIVFAPASGQTPASVTIGGNVLMGGGESLSELLDSLTYDHSVTESGGTYTFRAYVHKGGMDVTDDYDPGFCGWWLRTEDGDTWLGDGVTMTVAAADAGYRASVVGALMDYMEALVVDADGNGIVDADGNGIVTHTARSDA